MCWMCVIHDFGADSAPQPGDQPNLLVLKLLIMDYGLGKGGSSGSNGSNGSSGSSGSSRSSRDSSGRDRYSSMSSIIGWA